MQLLAVNNVGKAYGSVTPAKLLLNTLLAKQGTFNESNWILKDISFTANRGDAVGIIGINGSGKSTLLRMICNNVELSSGSITRRGRVSAILELGMGFHPDFTGHQNVALEAQINGMSRSEANRAVPEIKKFADIGKYFDKPVKIYSSGMMARLAFAVAIANKPEILVVDEALSVGDLSFQSKCIQRMRQLKEDGTCILFVSHSLNQVREFCDKALYLANGTQKLFGSVDKICDQYQNDLIPKKAKRLKASIKKTELKPEKKANPILRKYSLVKDGDCGSLDLEFLDFKVMNSSMNTITNVSFNEEVNIKADILANENVIEGTAVGLLIADKVGYHLLSCNSNLYDKFLPSLKKGERISMNWQFNWPFQAGQFRIDIGMKPNPFDNHFYDRVFSAHLIESFPQTELVGKNFGGYLFVDAKVKTSKIYK
jgi:lipopolysaccharide transport system ATP-binding protein